MKSSAFGWPRLACHLLFGALLATGMTRAVDRPTDTGAANAFLLGDHIALFLPAGLNLADFPPSPCLVAPPQPSGALPDHWRLRPKFVQSGAANRVIVTTPTGCSFYGTGEVTGPLRRNRQTIELWNTDNYKYLLDDGRRLYQSHPWVLGLRPDGSAFGVLIDSTWPAELSLQSGIEFTTDGPLPPVIVIERATPQAVLTALAKLTGTMPLPPRWALGYHQCRYSYHPDTRVREIADEFRARRIPCDAIWMDIDYMDGYRVFTFNPKEFSNPKGLNAYLHARGFKSVWMIDPGVKAEPGYSVFDTGSAADVWVHDAQGRPFVGKVWPGPCVFPDFTRPATRQWWGNLYRSFMAQGADGIWNDMNEPSVLDSPTRTIPPDAWHRGGGDLPPGSHRQYHNLYGLLMAEASRNGIAAVNPTKRPFVLTRSNFLGGQRYAATWTGDNASTGEYLKMSIPMTLNLGLSGQPFSGPDIGGFAGNATVDLWAHWIAIGALFPFSRGHALVDSPNKEPWAFGPVVESAARLAIERRYRLLPYLYTLFHESSIDGLPVMRPVFFADPRDLNLRNEEQAFLLGGDLLVIPKWADWPELPKGIWRTISLVGEDYARDKFQPEIRLRGGAILPLGCIVQNTSEESLAPLTLVVSLDAHGEAEGELYEDAGDGYGYRDGDYRLTKYRAFRKDGEVIVSVARREGDRAIAPRKVVVQVVNDVGIYVGVGAEDSEIHTSLIPGNSAHARPLR